jgi:two-component system, response regulator / RNA-binding antiterminator
VTYPTIANDQTILLIDASSSRASILKRALIEDGFIVVARLNSADCLNMYVEQYRPAILIVGIDTPDTDTLNQLATLNRTFPLPVVMFAEKDTPQIIQQAVKAGVSAYVVDDIQPQRLRSIITVAVARFVEQLKLRKELEKTKNKLAERKLLERAKGLLMKQQNISEDQAYNRLRKLAMDKGQTLSMVAENIIDVMALLDSP